MRKVITVNLNNTAYQVEDACYEALQSYLSTAGSRLLGNPDREAILAALEQAIGEKCDRFLGARRTVVTVAEVAQILREMGPVDSGSTEFETGTTAANTAGAGASRRLYRIPERKMIAGVCTGLAAYFGIDVVWIRILFVMLTLFTGVWLLVYLALIFIVPRADTAAEVAAAHGETFNARERADEFRTATRFP